MIAALLVGPIGVALAVGGACSSCSHGAAANGLEESAAPYTSSVAPSEIAAAVRPRRADNCDAGSLPRFTEKDLIEVDVRALLGAAAKRPIAVIRSDRGVQLVKDCQLNDGPYLEIPGKKDQGQVRPASRVVFRTDELEGACRAATHLIAAFALDAPISRRSGPAPRDAGEAGPRHLEGILVPLPCPSVADPRAALGCVGKGSNGRERRKRAAGLWARLPRAEGVFADVAQPLELYALVPDHFWGLSLAHWVKSRVLVDQGSWLVDQYDLGKVVPPKGQEDWMFDLYAIDPGVEPPTAKLKDPQRRTAPPFIYWDDLGHELIRDPPFMWCFPALVDPDVHYQVIF